MNPLEGSRHTAARHARWSVPLGVALVLGSLAATVPPGLAADPGPTAGADGIGLVAQGAFGRAMGLAAGTADTPPDPGRLPVLDAWARGTSVVVRPTEGTLSPWRAVAIAEPALDPGNAVELGQGDGDATFRLATSGLLLVRVDGTVRPDGDALEGSWWWRIAVPDRDLPEEETGPPPPAIVVASGADVASLEQGSGCHLGTCGDIGRVSPPDLLPTVRTIPRAPLAVSLSDGSAMVAWSVSATPVEGSGSEGILLGQADGTPMTQAWVPAPGTGEWVIAVSVTFDRERGRFDGYGRLVVAGPG
jgi:hypothetical protein